MVLVSWGRGDLEVGRGSRWTWESNRWQDAELGVNNFRKSERAVVHTLNSAFAAASSLEEGVYT